MEEEGCCEDSYRGEEDVNIPAEVVFARQYKALEKVKAEDLEEYSKKKVVYLKQNPAFVVAWIKDYLIEQFKQKNTFMEGFVGDIEANSYTTEYDAAKKQVIVKLNYIIDEEEESELELVGQLHRSEKGEIGIDWLKQEGNDYWLSSVEASLNESLKMLV
jgi:hypothetical protein